jgi:hypothetical protein
MRQPQHLVDGGGARRLLKVTATMTTAAAAVVAAAVGVGVVQMIPTIRMMRQELIRLSHGGDGGRWKRTTMGATTRAAVRQTTLTMEGGRIADGLVCERGLLLTTKEATNCRSAGKTRMKKMKSRNLGRSGRRTSLNLKTKWCG